MFCAEPKIELLKLLTVFCKVPTPVSLFIAICFPSDVKPNRLPASSRNNPYTPPKPVLPSLVAVPLSVIENRVSVPPELEVAQNELRT